MKKDPFTREVRVVLHGSAPGDHELFTTMNEAHCAANKANGNGAVFSNPNRWGEFATVNWSVRTKWYWHGIPLPLVAPFFKLQKLLRKTAKN